MRIVAVEPMSDAARATACAWLPDEYATIPRSSSPCESDEIVAYAPRNLKAPTRWRFSGLSATVAPASASSVREKTSGVRCATPWIRAAAASTSEREITFDRLNSAADGGHRQHEPVQERHAHRGRGRRLAHCRLPAREAGQGRRVRADEAEEPRYRLGRRQDVPRR